MFKLIRFFKGHRLSALLAPLFKLIEALFELIIPLVVAKIIDVGIANGDKTYILQMGGVMLLLGALGLGFSLTCQYLAARASLGFGTNVRKNLYSHINTLSFTELDKFGTSSLVTRLTSDVNQVQAGASMFIRLVLRAPFIAVGAIVMAMTIDVKLASIFVITSILVSVILFIIMSKSTKLYKAIQGKLDTVASLTRSSLEGARVVRAFSKEESEQAEFNTAATSLANSSVKVNVIASLLNPLSYSIINLSIVALLWFGSKQIYVGALSQGQIIALVNYLGQILLALVVTANLAVTMTKASACSGRIDEVLKTPPSIRDDAKSDPEKKENSFKIYFDNVSFAYGENSGHSLKNINLQINAGDFIGIIGATGSGKSTLVNLIPRFYDTSGGNVLIDGNNIKQYTFKTLRKNVAIVPQKAILFSGTIKENIEFGQNLTDEEVIYALKSAECWEFVSSLSEGINHRVERGGANFSGGQKQRLTIARALALKPEIIIFDDSFSALDYITSSKIAAAVNSMRGITVINVSQRLASLKNCDKIVVLDNGAIVGEGKHNELIKTCDVYNEILLSQSFDPSLKKKPSKTAAPAVSVSSNVITTTPDSGSGNVTATPDSGSGNVTTTPDSSSKCGEEGNHE